MTLVDPEWDRFFSDVGEAEPADVLVDGGEIVHVGALGVVEGRWDREVIRRDRLSSSPGSSNAHTHGRGHPPARSVGQLHARGLARVQLGSCAGHGTGRLLRFGRAGARFEMVRTGCTTAFESVPRRRP